MISGLTGASVSLTRGPKLSSIGGGRALVAGASSGIGWACAEALVEAGFEVADTSRRGADTPRPEGIQMVALNTSSTDDITAVVAHGPYDIIVASTSGSQSGTFGELPHETLERFSQINVLGQAGLLQQLLPGMREAGRGRVVLVDSILGGLPLSYRSSYVATETAVRGFGLPLHDEIAQFGIGVTVIEPGAIDTGISSRRMTYSGEDSAYATDVHRTSTKLNTNEERGIPASEIVGVVMHEVAAEWPLALVARGSSASVVVPLMRRVPIQTMLSIMRRMYGLQ